ncbi:hypothetical protein TeGR_g3050 [Tetraparma gracilis]|uniref:MFS transporter n=1 Tax=Tetraparma gracilis TaxID=2962635 RepID=A0ABQ6MRW9_9STRA|nr:hypothetical protein TeGR_g3050 [Tetraparma gracilis]
MIVLFHAYNRGFSAIEVAVMFSLYELAGVVTNLLAGVAGARWGIRSTLITGLGLQVFSYGLLFAWSDGWSKAGAIAYVTVASMFGGIAKDLTKLGGKTVTKLVTKDGQDTRLFKMVSLLTGMKNSLKGVGYFAGAALLDVNYYLALSAMLGLVVLAIPFAVLGLSDGLGTAKKSNATLRQALSLSNPNLNWLSLARLFLFASRDFWFEVPLPFYLRSPSCASLGPAFPCAADPDCAGGAFCGASGSCENLNVGGGCGGPGLSRLLVGTFLALYIIVYGQVQSWTPQLVTSPLGQTPPNKRTEIMWGLVNCAPTLVLAVALSKAPAFLDEDQPSMLAWLIAGIAVFAVIFAINSSIHSFLVVKYSPRDKVAVSVGFYYMSNAMGRLMGTMGSGLLYTYVGDYVGAYAGSDATAGLAACMIAGTVSSLLAALITVKIDDEEGGLRCGRIVCYKEEGEEEFAERGGAAAVVDDSQL